MRTRPLILAAMAASAACLIAQAQSPTITSPSVTAVVNGASYITPGLPNAGIAQGAIFVIFGSDLGPANISFAPTAFQSTTLSNTSVSVTVAGTTVNAPMYYTSAGQVAALLPSNTPTGTGTITVAYNGQTSSPVPITVVASNVGIFTIDSSGQGPGVVMFPYYSLVSAAKATVCGGRNPSITAAPPGGAPAFRSKLGFPLVPAET